MVLHQTGNYRAIALSSIFGKILDKIILDQQAEKFETSDLQFGFKKQSSIIMCSTSLIETRILCIDTNSSVYVLLIDASKAFDRVCHSTLFALLMKHNVCPIVLRLLYNIYSRSEMQVRWKQTLSDSFPTRGCTLPDIIFPVCQWSPSTA